METKPKSAASAASNKTADKSKPDPTIKETYEDIKKEIQKAQKFKPAPGVEFAQYDEFGLDKNDPEHANLRKFIAQDEEVLDTVIMAPDEIL